MGRMFARDYDGTVFYKVSKSTPNIKKLCAESHYIEYPSYSLVRDTGNHFLCYSPGELIISCIPYGDQLTEIIFDSSNPLFIQIKDEEVFCSGGIFDEHRSRAVITGKTRSLSEPTTIQYIIDMTPVEKLRVLANLPEMYDTTLSIPLHLKKLGFNESLEYWRYAMKQYQ